MRRAIVNLLEEKAGRHCSANTIRVYYLWFAHACMSSEMGVAQSCKGGHDKNYWTVSSSTLAELIAVPEGQVRRALREMNDKCSELVKTSTSPNEVNEAAASQVGASKRGRPLKWYSLVVNAGPVPSTLKNRSDADILELAVRLLTIRRLDGISQRSIVPERLITFVMTAFADSVGVVKGLSQHDISILTGLSPKSVRFWVKELTLTGVIRASVSGFKKKAFLGSVKTLYFLDAPNIDNIYSKPAIRGRRPIIALWVPRNNVGVCSLTKRTELLQSVLFLEPHSWEGQTAQRRVDVRKYPSQREELDLDDVDRRLNGFLQEIGPVLGIRGYLGARGESDSLPLRYMDVYLDRIASIFLSSFWRDLPFLYGKLAPGQDLESESNEPTLSSVILDYLDFGYLEKGTFESFSSILGDRSCARKFQEIIEDIIEDFRAGGACSDASSSELANTVSFLVILAIAVALNVRNLEISIIEKQFTDQEGDVDLSGYHHLIIPSPLAKGLTSSEEKKYRGAPDISIELTPKEGVDSSFPELLQGHITIHETHPDSRYPMAGIAQVYECISDIDPQVAFDLGLINTIGFCPVKR